MKEIHNEIVQQIKRAVELTENGLYDEALKIYNELLNKDIPDVYNNVGNIYRRQGMLGKAIEMYRRAIQSDPYFSLAYFNLACALMEMERYSDAVMFFEKAEKLGLQGFETDVQIALCYIALGNKRKASERMRDERVKAEVQNYIDGRIDL
ncbi:tetratricopeptide repeat protein [Fervidobacterium riparium]|uniref:PPR repeat-containing protein n=1 Tax=Fervidobacterium gondwanense DSM 13020 TaxID=1121883 RepID=A0A1M7TEC8_FERGO|nr:tetratricopeptide repeat protein [Fervidobacterium gondwanense]SHN69021.1 PPR repeat-containing protein [Fervidobacterium gondwanense DSM 13020]